MTKHPMNTAIGTLHTMRSKDGTTISYLSIGGGPAVIVIPGVLSMAADYAAFAHQLAEQFTVHTIERRGRGESGPQGADYSIVKEREDVLALRAETGASFLVGHSFGGLVALEAARNNPSLSKIAVYDPAVSLEGSSPMDWVPGCQKKLDEKKSLNAFVEFSLNTGPSRARNTPPWLMKGLLRLFLSSHERKQRLSLLQEGLRELQEQARLDRSAQDYQEIAASVLLLSGGKSDLPLIHVAIEGLAAVLPRSETKAFPTLDHFGIDKKAPQEVARAVSDYFLKEHIWEVLPIRQ